MMFVYTPVYARRAQDENGRLPRADVMCFDEAVMGSGSVGFHVGPALDRLFMIEAPTGRSTH